MSIAIVSKPLPSIPVPKEWRSAKQICNAPAHSNQDYNRKITLKTKTRDKRATTDSTYLTTLNQKLTMSVSDLLSSTKTKQELVPMLAESLLRYFENTSIKVVVAYKSQISTKTSSEKHSHEEADTLIPHQVLAASDAERFLDMNVLCPDTDVFNSMMDLVAHNRLPEKNKLSFHSGKKSQPTDIKNRVEILGKRKSAALIGLHNFSGADWGVNL